MAYNPNLPAGQAAAAVSAPVVLANDAPLAQDDILAVLNEIQVAVSAVASLRGIIADLRVSVVNTPATTVSSGTVTTVSTVSSVTNQAQMGGLTTNAAVQNWQNQTSQQAFTLNVTRS
jgi:hypothetical protein